MKSNKTWVLNLLLILASINLSAQNIFKEKVEGCKTDQFCLDCGTPKANYDSTAFNELIIKITNKYKITGGSGAVMFQVLVDPAGNGCVLSHTDGSHSAITADFIAGFNSIKWIPALQKGKAIKSSINVLITLADSKLTGQIKRVDTKEFISSTKSADPPTIYNKQYRYSNSNLSHYTFSVWDPSNSSLPGNLSQHCLIDADGILWYDTIDGLRTFDGKQFSVIDKSNSPFKADQTINAMAIDKTNALWFYTKGAIYKYSNKNWEKIDTAIITGAYHINPNASGEVLFASDKGVTIFKDGKWENLNTNKIKELPSNRAYFAHRDKAGRLWIGTFSGSVMINNNKTVTAFNNSETPLKNVCITGAVEDEDGNLYFSLYAYDNKNGQRDIDDEGLAVFTKDGNWLHYNDKNSGLPANSINSLFYDKSEKVLWIGSHYAGLVRFDLKNSWENYNNGNSAVPSGDVYQITQDATGSLYISTYNGLLKVSKK